MLNRDPLRFLQAFTPTVAIPKETDCLHPQAQRNDQSIRYREWQPDDTSYDVHIIGPSVLFRRPNGPGATRPVRPTQRPGGPSLPAHQSYHSR